MSASTTAKTTTISAAPDDTDYDAIQKASIDDYEAFHIYLDRLRFKTSEYGTWLAHHKTWEKMSKEEKKPFIDALNVCQCKEPHMLLCARPECKEIWTVPLSEASKNKEGCRIHYQYWPDYMEKSKLCKKCTDDGWNMTVSLKPDSDPCMNQFTYSFSKK